MFLLIIFSFLAGIITVLSPCILPILPIVLSGSVGGGKAKPFGIVAGFVASFTFFTLFLSSIVQATGLSANFLRHFAIVIIFLFGASLLVPQVQKVLEQLFARLSRFTPNTQNKNGFFGGIFIGISLGLLWTPCVGPILAAVISLAFTGSVTSTALFITLAYSIGTAIPMLAIIYGGRELLNKVPWLLQNSGKIQKVFGVIMIFTALGIYFNVDRDFQAYILEKFPQYGAGLTSLEDNDAVLRELDRLNMNDDSESQLSLPTSAQGPRAPELKPDGQWFNSEPFTLSERRGDVVLIDFWTYTCINCIRTLPYLRDWHEKYSDNGLVILGVHTPEFEFEKSADNLAEAIEDYDLSYPIVQDNEYRTWRAFNNRYWPAKYLVDKDGIIRYTHFGEGKYDETEEMIQELLEERNNSEISEEINNEQYSVEARTPELYLGYSRIASLVSPERISRNKLKQYSTVENLPRNSFTYEGDWIVSEEYASPQTSSKLHLRFQAKEVFLVMRSAIGASQAKLYLDGEELITSEAGEDVSDSMVMVSSDRLYHLVSLDQSEDRVLTIEFIDNNVEIFAFTFG